MRTTMIATAMLAAAVLFGLTPAAHAQEPFYLHDGDRVVFYGDSITAQALYTVYVDGFVHAAHPDWHITFLNAGVGGDRVDGGGAGKIDERLTRDVIARQPTVVTIMLGMNDRATPETRAAYAAGYQHILDRLKSELPAARLTLIGPSPFDDVTRPQSTSPSNADLAQMNVALRGFATRYGAVFVDFNAPGIAALQRANAANPLAATLALPDRVHPEPGFHLLMAETLLRAWHFPAVLQDVRIDAHIGTSSDGAKVESAADGLHWKGMELSGTDPLLPNDANETLNRILDPLPHLGLRTLHVSGLPAATYTVRLDDRVVAQHLSAQQLAAGVDLSSQASVLKDQARAIYYACSDSETQQVMRTRLLARRTEGAVAPYAAQGTAFLDANIGIALDRCRDAAQPKMHRWSVAKE